MTTERHYYRCEDCLTVVCANGPEVQDAQCAICAGFMECMGRVEGTRLVEHRAECPCDHRCTGARGPKCDCPCGGANHGTGLTVDVAYDRGPCPRLMVPANCEALAVATEWRAAHDRACGELRAYRNRKLDGHYLPDTDFQRMLDLGRAISRARTLKTHKARMKALTWLFAESAGVA